MFIWEVKGSSISKRPEVGLREVKWLEADFMADWREEEIEIAEEEDKRRRRRRKISPLPLNRDWLQYIFEGVWCMLRKLKGNWYTISVRKKISEHWGYV